MIGEDFHLFLHRFLAKVVVVAKHLFHQFAGIGIFPSLAQRLTEVVQRFVVELVFETLLHQLLHCGLAGVDVLVFVAVRMLR